MIGTDCLLVRAMELAKRWNWIHDGELVVALHGNFEGRAGRTNIVRIIEASSSGFTSPSNSLSASNHRTFNLLNPGF